MALEKIEIENFTAFDHLELTFSSGLNVLIGENGTGKTHLMKLGYASCSYVVKHLEVSELFKAFQEQKPPPTLPLNLIEIFRPYQDEDRRLIRKNKIPAKIQTDYTKNKCSNHFRTSKNQKFISDYDINPCTIPDGEHDIHYSQLEPLKCIYIPPKDALANAPGFRSLYEKREIHFESIYKDILDSAFLPFLRESNLTDTQQTMLAMLEKHMGGKVMVKGETFFLDNGTDEPLEFDLLAEGLRKLGLLWLLIRNGELDKDTVLFWDEPEANLNPKLMGVIVQVLIELQRMGVQIILATHNFVLLHEMHLRLEKQDNILFHSLYRDEETQEINVSSTAHYHQITHNPISEVYSALLERELEQSFQDDVSKDAAE